MILGSGPNRIGQGIEFDYCCCHAVFGFRKDGFETVMVNCNPETVSTDYDTADRLYFEPLTFEDVMAVIEREREGNADVSWSCSSAARRRSSWRCRCRRPASPSSAPRPTRSTWPRTASASRSCSGISASRSRPSGTAVSRAEAREAAGTIGFPVVVRPSYVLGGRAMAIVYDMASLDRYMASAVDVSNDRPILIDRFLEHAKELDVDCVADATGAVVIGGIMEHIEEAGIHSGRQLLRGAADRPVRAPPDDAARLHPAHRPRAEGRRPDERAVRAQGRRDLRARGEPARLAHVPYLAKATGVPLAQVAARVMTGKTLADLGLTEDLVPAGVFVKSPVFPFIRFPGVDTILGPEMKSTGEVMGGAGDFGHAFVKAMLGAGQRLPEQGTVCLSVNNDDKAEVVPIAKALAELGFSLLGTRGTAVYLRAHGVECGVVFKVNEGRPNLADEIVNRRIHLVVNTPLGLESFFDDKAVRRAAMMAGIPCITTMTGAAAAVDAVRALKARELDVRSLQEYYLAPAQVAVLTVRPDRRTCRIRALSALQALPPA